jgi:hypothetical protein
VKTHKPEYREEHFQNVEDVGIAFDGSHVWICFDGASVFRAKVMQNKLFVSYCPDDYLQFKGENEKEEIGE